MHVTGDSKPNPNSALRPCCRDTIDELLDSVFPDNPCPNLLRSERGRHWQVSELLRLKAPGLALRKATLIGHEPKSIEHSS